MAKYSRYNRPAEKKQSKWKQPWAIFIIGMMLYFAISGSVSYLISPMDKNDDKPIVMVIAKNSTLSTVSEQLAAQNLIRHPWVFSLYCRKNGLAEDIKAGEYAFKRSMRVDELADMITGEGPRADMITIPEGYTVEQIGQELVKREFCSQADWDKALKADYPYPFLPAKGAVRQPLEGFLFPDTYVLDKTLKPEQFIDVMLKNFAKRWEELTSTSPTDPASVLRTVTVASMIEREAVVPGERARIAGVIENRLKKNMPLQIDATVLYALGKHKDIVTFSDLEIDSPYNTYKYPGLPAGPIACPGKASLEAAMKPEKHEYYYYVTKGGGAHEFTKTYAEHLEAQKKYQK